MVGRLGVLHLPSELRDSPVISSLNVHVKKCFLPLFILGDVDNVFFLNRGTAL